MKQLMLMAGCLALLSGCSMLKQPAPQPEMLHYQCGTLPLTVTLDNSKEQVSFILDGKPLTLKQTISASGARYSNGQYTFWSKGNSAFIERDSNIVIDDCELQSPVTSAGQ